MEHTKSIFQGRCDEIKLYIEFIKLIDNQNTQFFSKDPSSDDGKPCVQLIDNNIKKIMKANVYLLLYNLVESTVKNALQYIYDYLEENDVSFHDISRGLQLLILTNLRKYCQNNTPEVFMVNMTDISKDIIYKTFNVKDRFSGNVDAKLIRDISKKMGLNIVTNKKAREGADLLSIKEQRNSLAHGEISFCDSGKDLTAPEVENMFKRTQLYLTEFIKCTQDFITNGSYKTS